MLFLNVSQNLFLHQSQVPTSSFFKKGQNRCTLLYIYIVSESYKYTAVFVCSKQTQVRHFRFTFATNKLKLLFSVRFLFPYFIYTYSYIQTYIHIFREFRLPWRYIDGNGADGKRQLPFVCCKQKTEIGSLFSLVGQTINGNRRLLFQQTCPSMTNTQLLDAFCAVNQHHHITCTVCTLYEYVTMCTALGILFNLTIIKGCAYCNYLIHF